MSKKNNQNSKASKRKKAKEIARRKKISKGGGVKVRRKSMSMSRLKKNLVNIPFLLFEQEFAEVKSKKSAEEILSHSQDEMERLEFFFDDEMAQGTKSALETISKRLNPKTERLTLINIQAMMNFFENQQSVFMNHISVGLYFRAIDPNGEFPFDRSNVVQFMADFEERHKDKIDQMMSVEDTMEETDAEESNEKLLADSNIDDRSPMLDEFSSYAEEIDPDNAEDAIEDIEIFLEDYILGERKIADLTQIRPTHFRMFNDYHFPEFMNPTDEDKQRMKQSLTLFAKFLHEKKEIFNEDQFKESSEL